jgi:hypothetical protein
MLALYRIKIWGNFVKSSTKSDKIPIRGLLTG